MNRAIAVFAVYLLLPISAGMQTDNESSSIEWPTSSGGSAFSTPTVSNVIAYFGDSNASLISSRDENSKEHAETSVVIKIDKVATTLSTEIEETKIDKITTLLTEIKETKIDKITTLSTDIEGTKIDKITTLSTEIEETKIDNTTTLSTEIEKTRAESVSLVAFNEPGPTASIENFTYDDFVTGNSSVILDSEMDQSFASKSLSVISNNTVVRNFTIVAVNISNEDFNWTLFDVVYNETQYNTSNLVFASITVFLNSDTVFNALTISLISLGIMAIVSLLILIVWRRKCSGLSGEWVINDSIYGKNQPMIAAFDNECFSMDSKIGSYAPVEEKNGVKCKASNGPSTSKNGGYEKVETEMIEMIERSFSSNSHIAS